MRRRDDDDLPLDDPEDRWALDDESYALDEDDLDADDLDDDDDPDADLEDDPSLDDDFPLGDGTADTSAEVSCPYCGESQEIAIDPGSGTAQSYVQDCEVCCNPWQVFVEYDAEGAAHVAVIPIEQ